MTDPVVVTWRELLRQTAETLGDRVHARWMCEAAAGEDGTAFLLLLDDPATERMVGHLDAMIARYGAGEPLQYVLGRWGFRRLDLAVDGRALIPRPETESVAEAAIDAARSFGPLRTVIDLGTGTGAIGLAAADELPREGTTVWLTDESGDALDLARANLAGLGGSAVGVRVVAGSWYDALPAEVLADVIVSNPPYVADDSPDVEAIVAGWEPPSALYSGADGLDAIREIVAGAPERLRPGGVLVLEIGADQGDAVRQLLAAAGFVELEIRTDLAGLDRVAVAERPSTLVSEPGLRVRRLTNRLDDYALLLRWLRTPEVLEWYEGRDQDFDFADILEEYGPGGEHEREGTEPLVVEVDDRPVGYVQIYELSRHAAEFGLGDEPSDGRDIWSLDLYVGEPDLLDTGLGRRIVRAVAQYLLAVRGARDVVIMPYPENERAVRSYVAAGFVAEAIVPDHEIHEGVMRDGVRMHFRPDSPSRP
ncbi:MAG: peptide chain release factor N(5)-glutamine methyltransferase [Acidimicrobiia bacterium]|nr:peptide chain release factor N(5)-glutamine methyltransferase [Acidimicrobiia bacterium]